MKLKDKLINLLDSLVKKLKGENNNTDTKSNKRIYHGKDLWKE